MLAAAITATLALGPAAANAESVPEPTPEAAAEALEAARQALEGAGGEPGEPGRHATVALGELADALPALEGGERRDAEAILARPTDGAGDRFGDGYANPALPATGHLSGAGHFCVWYVNATEDAPPPFPGGGDPTVPDYVETIADIAEFVYAREVGDLDWVAPKPDTHDDSCGPPASRTTDIYLKELGEEGLFGYEASDPDQRGRSRSGYLVIDNDYDRAQYPGYSDSLDPARVTLAHEFNHLLQERYDALQDLWMFESAAVWMEEQVFPGIDDYLNYVGRFAALPGAPLTDANAGRGLRIYGSAVWELWLESRYGPEVVRRAWEVSPRTNPPDFAVAAFDRAIDSEGGRGFSREFARFAAATAEWRTGAAAFPDASRYPDVRRKGVLRPGKRGRKRFKLDHSAYRLLRVKRTHAKRIRLQVRAQRNVRAGLALVARRGDEAGGEVKRKVKFLRKGGRGSVGLKRPRRFSRITAVVVNADGRQRGFSPARGDWTYRKDNARFVAKLKR